MGESWRQKFDPELSGAGAEEGGACARSTRDASGSWVTLSLSSLLEGPAAALPGHAQTRACPVDFRPGGLLCGIAALVLARLVQTRSLWSSRIPAPQRPTLDSQVAEPQWRVHWPPAAPAPGSSPGLLRPPQRLPAHRHPGTCGHPGSQFCRQLTPGTPLSKGTSASQATLGCLSCTMSRLLCSRSCAQSISVTGKACCWVSSLTLTTKSTSDVSSRQPSCSWPEPLTRTTSRAMCTSGLPRDWSIFLRQRRKVRPQPAWERCSPLRAHGLNQRKGPHQSDDSFHLEMCNCCFNSDSGQSNPAPPAVPLGLVSPLPPVRNVPPN